MDTMKRLDELLADHEMTLFDLAKACNINYSTFHAVVNYPLTLLNVYAMDLELDPLSSS